jgi:hypothetical protein
MRGDFVRSVFAECRNQVRHKLSALRCQVLSCALHQPFKVARGGFLEHAMRLSTCRQAKALFASAGAKQFDSVLRLLTGDALACLPNGVVNPTPVDHDVHGVSDIAALQPGRCDAVFGDGRTNGQAPDIRPRQFFEFDSHSNSFGGYDVARDLQVNDSFATIRKPKTLSQEKK